MSILDGGVTVQNGSNPSLVVEVKENQDSDPILLQLRVQFTSRKLRFSPKGEMVCFAISVVYLFLRTSLPRVMTQVINIPTWKWEMNNMDFITGLPHTHRQHDSIWVIVDRVTKSAHFLAVNTTNSVEDYTKLYINVIVRLNGVPLSIISDIGPPFKYHFWKSFQKGLGTQVNLSTTFHPQNDGQAERTIKTLEDRFRACVINFKGSWDDYLPLT
ncbi:hypothetical protein MTR67_023253 [Solanum verrucosum]|uniref:Integrase catalytic domain-containing protein n=1 Tax=Solanum verrucosum TaxID=315347 RepID=A0AAF0QWR8_SOLVR|nr:hypothetical protein MTR67_023253 [Solanum verrucosum]